MASVMYAKIGEYWLAPEKECLELTFPILIGLSTYEKKGGQLFLKGNCFKGGRVLFKSTDVTEEKGGLGDHWCLLHDMTVLAYSTE